MRIAALVILLSAPLAGWSQESPRELLDKMTHAVQFLNYEGTFVFVHGQKIETMEIVHGRDEHGVRERLISLTGEQREVIRKGGMLMCVWPQSNFMVIETSNAQHSLPAAMPADIDDLESFYVFALGAEERVAGESCRYVEITPKDNLRYGYRLCVDPGTGLLLKSEMLGADGDPVESFMFANVRLHDSIPEYRFESTMKAAQASAQVSAADGRGAELDPDPMWSLTDMPAGFEVTQNARRVMEAGSEPVQHMVLSDGLASVSVFIAAADSDQDWEEGATRSGALHAYARKLKQHRITVVGEVPGDTVKLIGQSIAYKEAAAGQ